MKGPNDALARDQMLSGSYFSIEPSVPVSTFNVFFFIEPLIPVQGFLKNLIGPRVSILDTIFHISRPLVLGSLENYSSAFWFQTGFDSTYLHITLKKYIYLFTSTISPIKCDHLYINYIQKPTIFF